jgi:hypothetical protein
VSSTTERDVRQCKELGHDRNVVVFMNAEESTGCGNELGDYEYTINLNKKKLRGFSLQANYTDCCLSAKLVQTFAGRGVAWSAQQIPMAVNLGFLDQSCHFFI